MKSLKKNLEKNLRHNLLLISLLLLIGGNLAVGTAVSYFQKPLNVGEIYQWGGWEPDRDATSPFQGGDSDKGSPPDDNSDNSSSACSGDSCYDEKANQTYYDTFNEVFEKIYQDSLQSGIGKTRAGTIARNTARQAAEQAREETQKEIDQGEAPAQPPAVPAQPAPPPPSADGGYQEWVNAGGDGSEKGYQDWASAVGKTPEEIASGLSAAQQQEKETQPAAAPVPGVMAPECGQAQAQAFQETQKMEQTANFFQKIWLFIKNFFTKLFKGRPLEIFVSNQPECSAGGTYGNTGAQGTTTANPIAPGAEDACSRHASVSFHYENCLQAIAFVPEATIKCEDDKTQVCGINWETAYYAGAAIDDKNPASPNGVIDERVEWQKDNQNRYRDYYIGNNSDPCAGYGGDQNECQAYALLALEKSFSLQTGAQIQDGRIVGILGGNVVSYTADGQPITADELLNQNYRNPKAVNEEAKKAALIEEAIGADNVKYLYQAIIAAQNEIITDDKGNTGSVDLIASILSETGCEANFSICTADKIKDNALFYVSKYSGLKYEPPPQQDPSLPVKESFSGQKYIEIPLKDGTNAKYNLIEKDGAVYLENPENGLLHKLGFSSIKDLEKSGLSIDDFIKASERYAVSGKNNERYVEIKDGDQSYQYKIAQDDRGYVYLESPGGVKIKLDSSQWNDIVKNGLRPDDLNRIIQEASKTVETTAATTENLEKIGIPVTDIQRADFQIRAAAKTVLEQAGLDNIVQAEYQGKLYYFTENGILSGQLAGGRASDNSYILTYDEKGKTNFAPEKLLENKGKVLTADFFASIGQQEKTIVDQAAKYKVKVEERDKTALIALGDKATNPIYSKKYYIESDDGEKIELIPDVKPNITIGESAIESLNWIPRVNVNDNKSGKIFNINIPASLSAYNIGNINNLAKTGFNPSSPANAAVLAGAKIYKARAEDLFANVQQSSDIKDKEKTEKPAQCVYSTANKRNCIEAGSGSSRGAKTTYDYTYTLDVKNPEGEPVGIYTNYLLTRNENKDFCLEHSSFGDKTCGIDPTVFVYDNPEYIQALLNSAHQQFIANHLESAYRTMTISRLGLPSDATAQDIQTYLAAQKAAAAQGRPANTANPDLTPTEAQLFWNDKGTKVNKDQEGSFAVKCEGKGDNKHCTQSIRNGLEQMGIADQFDFTTGNVLKGFESHQGAMIEEGQDNKNIQPKLPNGQDNPEYIAAAKKILGEACFGKPQINNDNSVSCTLSSTSTSTTVTIAQIQEYAREHIPRYHQQKIIDESLEAINGTLGTSLYSWNQDQWTEEELKLATLVIASALQNNSSKTETEDFLRNAAPMAGAMAAAIPTGGSSILVQAGAGAVADLLLLQYQTEAMTAKERRAYQWSTKAIDKECGLGCADLTAYIQNPRNILNEPVKQAGYKDWQTLEYDKLQQNFDDLKTKAGIDNQNQTDSIQFGAVYSALLPDPNSKWDKIEAQPLANQTTFFGTLLETSSPNKSNTAQFLTGAYLWLKDAFNPNYDHVNWQALTPEEQKQYLEKNSGIKPPVLTAGNIIDEKTWNDLVSGKTNWNQIPITKQAAIANIINDQYEKQYNLYVDKQMASTTCATAIGVVSCGKLPYVYKKMDIAQIGQAVSAFQQIGTHVSDYSKNSLTVQYANKVTAPTLQQTTNASNAMSLIMIPTANLGGTIAGELGFGLLRGGARKELIEASLAKTLARESDELILKEGDVIVKAIPPIDEVGQKARGIFFQGEIRSPKITEVKNVAFIERAGEIVDFEAGVTGIKQGDKLLTANKGLIAEVTDKIGFVDDAVRKTADNINSGLSAWEKATLIRNPAKLDELTSADRAAFRQALLEQPQIILPRLPGKPLTEAVEEGLDATYQQLDKGVINVAVVDAQGQRYALKPGQRLVRDGEEIVIHDARGNPITIGDKPIRIPVSTDSVDEINAIRLDIAPAESVTADAAGQFADNLDAAVRAGAETPAQAAEPPKKSALGGFLDNWRGSAEAGRARKAVEEYIAQTSDPAKLTDDALRNLEVKTGFLGLGGKKSAGEIIDVGADDIQNLATARRNELAAAAEAAQKQAREAAEKAAQKAQEKATREAAEKAAREEAARTASQTQPAPVTAPEPQPPAPRPAAQQAAPPVTTNIIAKPSAPIQENDVLVLGRESFNGPHIQVDDAAVSEHHAKIRVENGEVRIYDQATTNGTFVNTKRITAQSLVDGDKIQLGSNTEFTFKVNPDGSSKLISKDDEVVANFNSAYLQTRAAVFAPQAQPPAPRPAAPARQAAQPPVSAQPKPPKKVGIWDRLNPASEYRQTQAQVKQALDTAVQKDLRNLALIDPNADLTAAAKQTVDRVLTGKPQHIVDAIDKDALVAEAVSSARREAAEEYNRIVLGIAPKINETMEAELRRTVFEGVDVHSRPLSAPITTLDDARRAGRQNLEARFDSWFSDPSQNGKNHIREYVENIARSQGLSPEQTETLVVQVENSIRANRNNLINGQIARIKPPRLTQVSGRPAIIEVATSDPHGDWNQLVRLLSGQAQGQAPGSRPRVLDARGQWIGGKNHRLRILGDMLDRAEGTGMISAQTAENIRLLQISAGVDDFGENLVEVNLGNHEAIIIMQMRNFDQYLAEGETVQKAAELVSIGNRFQFNFALDEQDIIYLHNNRDLLTWLKDLPAISKSGDTLYFHSNTFDYRLYGATVEEINQNIRAILHNGEATFTDAWGRQSKKTIKELAEDMTQGNLNRITEFTILEGQTVDDITKHFGVNRLVHGHDYSYTPRDQRVTNLDRRMNVHYGLSDDLGSLGDQRGAAQVTQTTPAQPGTTKVVFPALSDSPQSRYADGVLRRATETCLPGMNLLEGYEEFDKPVLTLWDRIRIVFKNIINWVLKKPRPAEIFSVSVCALSPFSTRPVGSSISETLESTNEDIYKTWGGNRTRIDLPAYGPEFAEWKDSTPGDVQKTILDYMTARKIITDPDEKLGFLANQIPKAEYDVYRQRAISEADQVAPDFSI